MLQVTEPAPDFELECVDADGVRKQVRLATFAGRWLVLFFYPRDFSLVCPTEVTAFSHKIDSFRTRDAVLLGVSVDSIETHLRWMQTRPEAGGVGPLHFPLASDPDGTISSLYGVFQAAKGIALRGLFVIDPQGKLQYQVVHNHSVGRHSDEVLRILDALQSQGLCAESWTRQSAAIDPTSVIGPGHVISHYRIEKRLGAGTFAAVFSAWDMQLERRVALKILRSLHGAMAGEALAEARAAASLSHPHVCTIFSVDDSDGVPLIAMEYLEGKTLGRWLNEGPLGYGQTKRLAQQMASGMAAAHDAGVIHGDLKPANVLVNEDLDRATIVDFGLASKLKASPNLGSPKVESDPDATWAAEPADRSGIFGTPAYLSPERTRGEPAAEAADSFALGAVIYEMATGKKAFSGDNAVRVLQTLCEFTEGAHASELQEPLASVVKQTLRHDPAHRLSMRQIFELLA